MSDYITPYLPKDALAEARSWAAQNKAVFQKVMPQSKNGSCPNCSGTGLVMLQFASKGPFKTPPGGKDVVTWFDGDGAFGKGWYIVAQTIPYACPECAKRVGELNGKSK